MEKEKEGRRETEFFLKASLTVPGARAQARARACVCVCVCVCVRVGFASPVTSELQKQNSREHKSLAECPDPLAS